jgi:2-polyprenyl-3-methyl-5-hydroxy-6-metoxy-1,4-benzoquinol methylase
MDFSEIFVHLGETINMEFNQKERSINYYNKNGKAFFKETAFTDMSRAYKPFIERLPEGSYILDGGCGTGRDTLALLTKGYHLTAFDASDEMVNQARHLTGIDIQKCRFEDFTSSILYDGIWTCASLLHIPLKELPIIMNHLAAFLKPGGICYMSFKHGSGERFKRGRYFTDLNQHNLRLIIKEIPVLSILSVWITKDSRPDHNEEWLNALIQKHEKE